MSSDILLHLVKWLLVPAGVWLVVFLALGGTRGLAEFNWSKLTIACLAIWVILGLQAGVWFYGSQWTARSPLIVEEVGADGQKTVTSYFDIAEAPPPGTPGVRVLRESRVISTPVSMVLSALTFRYGERSWWCVVDLAAGIVWGLMVFALTLLIDVRVKAWRTRTTEDR